MRGNWPLIALAAGSLLLGIARGATATPRWARHGDDDRHHQSDWRAEHRRERIRAEKQREAERRRERLRAEEARRERERHRRTVRAHARRSEHAFDYIRAADRARHRR
jgi:hypothetical protein